MASTFWTGAGTSDAQDTNVGMPGAAPLGTGLMQGNPVGANTDPCIAPEPAQPQNSSAQLTGTQLANSFIPHNLQTTNVLQGSGPNVGSQPPGGGDSLLAQMSRGQVIMADSTYGQGGFIPQNGGCSPQVASPAASVTQPSLARVASGVTEPANANFSGM
jgi:hypothetical protein